MIKQWKYDGFASSSVATKVKKVGILITDVKLMLTLRGKTNFQLSSKSF